MQSLDKRLSDLHVKVEKIEVFDENLVSLQKTVALQSRKIAELEDRSRCSNLVIYGISEVPNESSARLNDTVVTDIFAKKLDVSCTSVGRIHRLGRNGKNRPVILYLQDYSDKVAILRNAKTLKGTAIFIRNDYSQHTLKIRKLLWDSAKLNKAKGERVRLVNDKMWISDDVYTWDEALNVRVQLPATKRPVNPELRSSIF